MAVVEVSSLCDHAFVNELRHKIPTDQNKCMDLLAYGQDILYIWNSFDACIHSVNIKHTVRDRDLSTQIILQPTSGILFSPEKIFLNLSSTLLAVSANAECNSGVAILELPDRWSTSNKRQRIQCRHLGERIFYGEQQTLRQVKWHPGSPSDSHILVLSSDECLRLYDATTGDILWKCLLSQNSKPIRANLPTKITLGDTPIDFDVAPSSYEDPTSIKWPILVLWGNGDIYCVESTLEDAQERFPIQGPLRMFPSSDDNYGSDASSIIVLQTSPPIVTFSTCIGTIYNCLFLSSEDSESAGEKSLYVVECIELELGIPLGDDEEIVSCPIKLMKNPIEKSIFFSIHKAGIHSITLPLATKLHEFFECSELDFSPYISESIVEYLLCTGVSKGSNLDSLPLLGCAFVDLSSSLLVILNNQDIINIKVTPHFLHMIQDSETLSSNIRNEDGFLMHIQNMLKEHGPGPVIKLPEANPKDLINVIYKMKMSYQSTMDAHNLVGSKLEAKSNTLMAALIEQQKEIDNLTKQRQELYETSLQIARSYNEVNEKQLGLMNSIENILRNVCVDSKLTEKERHALDYLGNIQNKVVGYEEEVKRIRTACKHQENILEERVENMTRKGIDLGDMRGRIMRKQLHSLTREISDLMNRVKSLEETVPEAMFRSSTTAKNK